MLSSLFYACRIGSLDRFCVKCGQERAYNGHADENGRADHKDFHGINGTAYSRHITYAKYGIYFDPLNPDTNGNGILDGDEVFGQSKQQEVETHDKSITEIKVDMTTNGNLDRNLTIKSMYNIDVMSTNVYSLIGEPFNFETPTSFKSATITFKVDKSKLGDTKFDNLLILWYDEENQIFKEMETIHDEANSTVSTTTTHFSQYMIVDSEKWFDNWEESFKKLREMWSGNTSYYKALNTILIVDCSWKMANVDPIDYRSIEIGYNGVTQDNYYEIVSDMDSPWDVEQAYLKYGRRKCSRTNICENIINNISSGDRIALMMYGSGIQSNTGLTGSYYPLMFAVQNVNNDGGSMYLNNAVSAALSYVTTNDINNMYRIIVLTTGDVSFGYDLSSYDYTNVSLNVVNLGGGSPGSYLESITHDTGGDIYYGYTAGSLTGVSGVNVEIPSEFTAEDYDEDGIPDLVELYGLKPNGQPIESNPELGDTDDDGLEDNEELHFSSETMTYELDKSQYDGSVFIWSDPCLEDTDGDFDWDNIDPNPREYQLNGYLTSNISKLEKLALEYKEKNNLSSSDYEINVETWLAFMFIRQFNSGYVSGTWSGTANAIDKEFVDYVLDNDSELYNYFSETKSFYVNESGELGDLYHMCATLTGHIYKSSFFDGIKFGVMPEYHIDNLSGWAGDLQTLINDTYCEIGENCSYDEFYNTFYNLIGKKSFSMPDMYADIDAYNIYKLLFDYSIEDALQIYYQRGYNKRFSEFTNYWSKDMITELVSIYTNNDYIIIQWPLLEFNVKETHSKAACDAFVDFLMEKIKNE